MPGDIITHGDSSIDWGPGGSAIGEKVTRLLIFYLRLPLHIAEELDWRRSVLLPSRTEESDGHNAKQPKSNQEVFNHPRKLKLLLFRRSPRGTPPCQRQRNADRLLQSR